MKGVRWDGRRRLKAVEARASGSKARDPGRVGEKRAPPGEKSKVLEERRAPRERTRSQKSLRIDVHIANGVVWEPV